MSATEEARGPTAPGAERRRLLDDSEISLAQFRALANSMPSLAWMADPDGWIFWYNRRWLEYTGLSADELAGWGWQAVHDPQRLPEVLDRWTKAIASGQSFEMTFPLRGADGVFRPFLTRIEPLRERGRIVGWFGANIDVTEQERTRERLQLLVNELNHRVKNTLALVLSLAAQTFRGREPEALEAFEQRILALSLVHEMLTRRNWADLDVADVVRASMRFIAPTLYEVAGPNLMVEPRIATSLALVLHELTTNAVRHGALTRPEGRVAVRWAEPGARRGQALARLSWRESGGPTVARPRRRGFGTRLIERVLAGERGAGARLVFDPAGLACELTFPCRPAAAALGPEVH